MDRRDGVRVRTAVWTAVLLTVLLGVGGSALRYLVFAFGPENPVIDLLLDGPVLWPDGWSPVPARLAVLAGQLVSIGLLVGWCTWLGARVGSVRRGFWSVLLCCWFGVVLAGALGAALIVPLSIGTLVTDGPSLLIELVAYAGGGAGWGVRAGWLPALVAALVLRSQLRRARPDERPDGLVSVSPAD